MKTIECVDCGESVPYGRLSCPACGALLASVARGRTPVVPVAAPAEPAAAWFEAVESFDPGPTAGSVATATAVASATPAVPASPIATTKAVAIDIESLLPELPVEEPSLPELPEAEPSLWSPLEATPDPVLTPRAYRTPSWASVAVAPERSTPRLAVPGAYRPPALSMATAGAGFAAPAWSGASGLVDGGAEAVTAEPELKARLGAIDPARFVEIAGWLVVVGSTLSVLGLLLPWSQTVIGAASYGDYFDAWGLASPTHWFVLAGLLSVLALGIVRTTVPIWLRTGVLGLGLGGLLVGLVWPYLVGPLGADVGVLCVGLGGVAMTIGGAVVSWATRHVEVEPVV